MTVILTYTQDLDSKISFSIYAGLITATSVIALFMVREPSDVKPKKISCNKLCDLVKKSAKLICSVREVFLGFFQLMFVAQDSVIAGIYVQAWLNSLVGTLIPTKEDAMWYM